MFTSPNGIRVSTSFQLELHSMPTIVTHAAVPICLGLGLGSRIISLRLLLAGVAIAMLPDADVCSPSNWGRLWPMSLAIAALPIHCCSPLPAHAGHAVSPPSSGQRRHRLVVSAGLFALPQPARFPSPQVARGLAGSGRGVTSVSLPLAGDPVAPFKLEAYLTARGEAVILSELYWVWLPGVVLVLMGWRWKRGR